MLRFTRQFSVSLFRLRVMTVSARAVYFCLLVAWLLAGPVLSGRAGAQYFGRNKVEYHDFQFRTLQTEHFDI